MHGGEMKVLRSELKSKTTRVASGPWSGVGSLAGVLFVLLTVHCSLIAVQAQTTEFTFQGSLTNAGTPANGNFDFEFLLFNALAGGSQQGPTVARNGVSVSNGIFAVTLDFGNQFPGAARFIEIHVRQTGGGGFTILAPRQSVASAPYAVKSISADSGGSTPANYVYAYTSNGSQSPGGGGIVFQFNGPINGWTHSLATSTFTCGQTGLYMVSYSVQSYNVTVTSIRAAISLNGSEVAGSQNFGGAGAGAAIPYAKSVIVNVNKGDVITLTYNGTASTFNSYPIASIAIVRVQ